MVRVQRARLAGLVSVLGTAALLCIALVHTQLSARSSRVVLYNQWGTNDDNEHWGGVGSENYHTAKWDNTGYNENYHPRDSSSGDGESMEPAWWRSGPGANSEHTGPGTSGELYNPPDVKVFKPFFMKARKQALYDIDGPQPSDGNPAQWAAAGRGTAAWMLDNEGPLLATQQELKPGQKLVKGGQFDGGKLPPAIVRPQYARKARMAHMEHRAQAVQAPRGAGGQAGAQQAPGSVSQQAAPAPAPARPVDPRFAGKPAPMPGDDDATPARKMPWNSDLSPSSTMGTNDVFLGAPQGGYARHPRRK
jgi:hypothetical protein